METFTFLNSFASWYETHHEVVNALTLAIRNERKSLLIEEYMEAEGFVGMYQLAKELTDEFENLNKDRQWDGEFFDEIWAFMEKKIGDPFEGMEFIQGPK